MHDTLHTSSKESQQQFFRFLHNSVRNNTVIPTLLASGVRVSHERMARGMTRGLHALVPTNLLGMRRPTGGGASGSPTYEANEIVENPTVFTFDNQEVEAVSRRSRRHQ